MFEHEMWMGNAGSYLEGVLNNIDSDRLATAFLRGKRCRVLQDGSSVLLVVRGVAVSWILFHSGRLWVSTTRQDNEGGVVSALLCSADRYSQKFWQRRHCYIVFKLNVPSAECASPDPIPTPRAQLVHDRTRLDDIYRRSRGRFWQVAVLKQGTILVAWKMEQVVARLQGTFFVAWKMGYHPLTSCHPLVDSVWLHRRTIWTTTGSINIRLSLRPAIL